MHIPSMISDVIVIKISEIDKGINNSKLTELGEAYSLPMLA